MRMSNYRMDQKGSVSVFTVLVLLGILATAALAIDVGYIMVAKNELQNVADSAALAAARKMEDLYSSKTPYDSDFKQAVMNAAKAVAEANAVAGKKVVLRNSDIEIGTWDFENRAFACSGKPGRPVTSYADVRSAGPMRAGQTIMALCNPFPCAFACSNPNPNPNPDSEAGSSIEANAVSITVHRDNETSPISTFFAKIFGKNSVPITAKAIAALSASKSIEGRRLLLPAGISKNWFKTAGDSNWTIQFHPTKESGAGWHTYTEPANAHNLKQILEDIRDGSYVPPEAKADQENFNFIGGDVASAFKELEKLFDTMRVKNDNDCDLDTDPNTWTTNVVVYDDSDSMKNPHGSLKIVGFAQVTIQEVNGPPDKTIIGKVTMVDPTRPGEGGLVGTLGLPRLVL